MPRQRLGPLRALSATAIDVKAYLNFPARPGFSGGALSLTVMQTGAASEGTGGVGPDQFRALAGNADYRNVWLSRHGQGMRHGAQAIPYHVYRTVPVPA